MKRVRLLQDCKTTPMQEGEKRRDEKTKRKRRCDFELFGLVRCGGMSFSRRVHRL